MANLTRTYGYASDMEGFSLSDSTSGEVRERLSVSDQSRHVSDEGSERDMYHVSGVRCQVMNDSLMNDSLMSNE